MLNKVVNGLILLTTNNKEVKIQERTMKIKNAIAGLLVGVASLAGNAMAQNVYDASMWYNDDNYSTYPSFSNGSTVTAPGYNYLQISGNDDQITISFSPTTDQYFSAGSFNGYYIDLAGGSFSGVSLDSSTMTGFVAGDIALVSGEIQVNMQSLPIISGQDVVLDVNGNTGVPEPTTLALASVGGLMLLIRRRK